MRRRAARGCCGRSSPCCAPPASSPIRARAPMSPSGRRRKSTSPAPPRSSPSPGGSTDLPVLVATGYVVARHSSDVGVKTGGRLARLRFEEGTRVRKGEVIAEIEHADIDAQLEASRRAVAEADAQLAQAVAARDEDMPQLRTAARADEGRHHHRRGADRRAGRRRRVGGAREVRPRRRSRRPARASASPKKRSRTPTCARRSTASSSRSARRSAKPCRRSASQGRRSREGGAIATIADLGELEVQTEVSENSVAKLTPAMPAEVKLQAYPGPGVSSGRLRQIFPSADRAKAIVEVRVTHSRRRRPRQAGDDRERHVPGAARRDGRQRMPSGASGAAPGAIAADRADSEADAHRTERRAGGLGRHRRHGGAPHRGARPRAARSGGSARAASCPGEALILNPPAGARRSMRRSG